MEVTGTKISQLDPAGVLVGTEDIPIVKNGSTVKTTPNAIVAAEASARALGDTAQSFAAVVLTNPFTAGKAPRRIGDFAVNTTSGEIWQATAITNAAASWNCISAGYYNGRIITNWDTHTQSGDITSYSTATGAPTSTESFYGHHINSNAGTVNAVQWAIGYTTNKIYIRTKTDSTWGEWSTGITATELGYLSGVTSNIQEQLIASNDEQIQGGIYDVSSHNDGAVFESLSTLLGSANLSTLIPTSVRHGGMSIRFIQCYVPNSDNKYVQYRLMTDDWSTNVSDWQGVDDEPTAGSNNLVKSGGVYRIIGNEIIEEITVTQGGVLSRGFEYQAKTGDKVCITIQSLGAALGYTIIRDNNNHVLSSFTLAANASVKKEFTLEYDISELIFYSETIITTGSFSINISMANSVFCQLENIDSEVQTIDVTPLESDGDTIAAFKKGNTTKQIKSGLSKQFIQLEIGKNVISVLTCTQGVTLEKSISFPCSTGDILKISIQSLGAALGYTIIRDNNNHVLSSFTLAANAHKESEIILENDITRLIIYTENVNTSGDLSFEFIRYGELYQSVLENTKRLDTDEVSLNKLKLNKNFLRGLIRNVLCIGDSVTHGLVSDYPHTGYNTNLVSYPRFLQQISGWSITNSGHSSWNADEWFTQWINNYTYTNYDMALMEFGYNGDLTDTLDTDCPLAATWISGQSYSVGNDVTYNHLRYKCETPNSDVTFDISKWRAAYNEYANTHTGYYCKIIEAILNANPSLLFILIIPARFFPNYGSTIVIRKIAERYGLMVVNLYDSSLINLNDNKYHGYLDAEKQAQDIRDTTHFNLIGYCYKAELIYAQLLDLFHENTALLNLNTEERYMSISDSGYNKVTDGFLNPTV